MYFKKTTCGRLKEGDRIALDINGETKTTIVTKKMKGTRDYLICHEKIEGYPYTHMRVLGSNPVNKLNKGWDVREENGTLVYFNV